MISFNTPLIASVVLQPAMFWACPRSMPRLTATAAASWLKSSVPWLPLLSIVSGTALEVST